MAVEHLACIDGVWICFLTLHDSTALSWDYLPWKIHCDNPKSNKMSTTVKFTNFIKKKSCQLWRGIYPIWKEKITNACSSLYFTYFCIFCLLEDMARINSLHILYRRTEISKLWIRQVEDDIGGAEKIKVYKTRRHSIAGKYQILVQSLVPPKGSLEHWARRSKT